MKKISENEELILKYIKNNLSNSLKIGVRGVAKETYSSTSTIIRLAKKLGYSGFIEMIYSFKELYENPSPVSYGVDFSSNMMFQVNNTEGVDDFLYLLKDSKIALYGEGFSKIIADYFYMKFMVLGIDCKIIDPTIDVEVFERNGINFDTLILISKSGEREKSNQLEELFKRSGVKTVSFTGNIKSQLAKSSDISFVFFDKEKEDTDIYYPNPFFGYCLVGFEELIKKYFEKNNIV